MKSARISRSRSDFESWTEPGLKFLSEHISKKATDAIELESKSSFGILALIPDEILSTILPMVIKEVEEKYLKEKLEQFADNLEMIYAANPDIMPKDAIKIVFFNSSLVREFGEDCINNAISKC